MKTFIVQLEKFDNLASVREKMKWSKAERILIVWPKRGKPDLTIADLEVIQREAHNLGAEAAFVCQEPVIEDAALTRNLQVFHSVPQAQRSHWQRTSSSFIKTKPRSVSEIIAKTPKKAFTGTGGGNRPSRMMILIVSVLAILALAGFFVPHAVVIIHPKLTTKIITINITASPQFGEININGNLPAKVQKIELTKTGSGQSSGKTKLPSTAATGEVVFTNISGMTVDIPTGTLIVSSSSPDVKFVTLSEAALEAGKESAPVEIKAVKDGSSGNLSAGDLTTIEGQLGAALDVTNPKPTSGGEDVQAPSPTEEDYANIKADLMGQMRQDAISLYQQGDVQLIPVTLDEGTVISEVRSADVGTAADTFSLTLEVEFQGLTYSRADLDRLVNETMDASLEPGTMIYGNGVSITSQGNPSRDLENGVKWMVEASAETGTSIDKNTVIESITGKPVIEALKMIQTVYPLREETEIKLFPAGWKWMPWISLNIQVVVK